MPFYFQGKKKLFWQAPPARAIIAIRNRKRIVRSTTAGTAIRGIAPSRPRQKPAQFEKVKNNDFFILFIDYFIL